MIEMSEMDCYRRSAKLLFDNLNPEQKKCFYFNGYFYVGKYIICSNTPFNVIGPKDQYSGYGLAYCCMFKEQLPIFDLMLAQKILIELDENSFLWISNMATIYSTFYISKLGECEAGSTWLGVQEL
jgi:hypothetical protein